jgi:DHA1 family multidrug resistance protein-like MFS transporter
MGAGKEYPPLLPDPEDFVVEFDGAGDPLHPYNWSLMRRYAFSMAEASSVLDC